MRGKGAVASHLIDPAHKGAGDGPIEIVEYDPSWPACYDAECARLAPLLPGVPIFHIGSTAVPGRAAKPVVDMIGLFETSSRESPRSCDGRAISYALD